MGPTTGTNRTHSTGGYQTLKLYSHLFSLNRHLQLPLALNAVLLDQCSQSARLTKSVNILPAYILVTEQQIKGLPLPSKACVVTTTQLARPKERALPSLWAGNQRGGQGQERIHHVFGKMKCFSLGLAHSQLKRMSGMVVPRWNGETGARKLQVQGHLAVLTEFEASVAYTRESLKTILKGVSLNY